MFMFLSVFSVLKNIGYIFIAILVLLFMVLIHELGHYTAGKILKFKINEFSVGFGPKLLQKKKMNGERVSLRLIPLGGYCAFEGETEDILTSPDAFNNQAPWKRLIVLFFGAFFNFLSAILFSFVLLLSCGYEQIQIKNVTSSSINYNILQQGDVVYGINDVKIDFVKDNYFNNMISIYVESRQNDFDVSNSNYSYNYEGKILYMQEVELPLMIKRKGEKITVNANVNAVFDSNGKYQGWTFLKTEQDDSSFAITTYKLTFAESLIQSVPFCFRWAKKILIVFGQLITGKLSITSVGGPITTVNMIATYSQQSLRYLALLLPVIAVNLAVFNLLPIPALDGFQMVFVLVEWVRKKPIKREVINVVNNVGLIVLFAFVIVVDILQFVL